MNVMQIASQANPTEVLRHYLEAYTTLHGHDEESIATWRHLLSTTVGVQSEMYVAVTLNGEHFDVSGVGPGDEQDDPDMPPDTRWSLSLTPWSKWKLLPVVDATGLNLNTDQLAAHLFYEMTWHGWPEETEQLADALHDQVEELKRALDSGRDLSELGYTRFNPKDFGVEDD